tara:strand:- start:1717 stop:3450 length:1734 start_codon:yes stop_codon:yes gene_type:complete
VRPFLLLLALAALGPAAVGPATAVGQEDGPLASSDAEVGAADPQDPAPQPAEPEPAPPEDAEAPDDGVDDEPIADDEPTDAELEEDELGDFGVRARDRQRRRRPEGPPLATALRYYFEDVEVRGNERTRSSVIRHYVPYEEGDVVDPSSDQLEDIEWLLRGTGFFREVTISLKRGTRRGWVVVVVDVEERNTIVVTQLVAGISEGLQRSTDREADAVPYLGFTLAETNLLGTGAQLSLSLLGSTRAQAVRVAYDNPLLLRRGWSFGAAAFFNSGRHYFGSALFDPNVNCLDDEGMPRPSCVEERTARNIVIFYRRAGAALSTGHGLGSNSRITLGYQIEGAAPRGDIPIASISYGDEVRPFVANFRDDLSWISMLRATIEYDKRNDPSMTTRGIHFRMGAELSTPALGSDYEFLRASTLFRAWAPLPWRDHALRFSLFLGTVFGEAPFFYQFQIADLTDLVPSQVLEMQLDRRGAPNILGTAIGEMRVEELAGRFDVQYELPIFRGRRVRRLNLVFNVGILYLTDPDALRLGVAGYSGAAQIPVDLTFDLGLRFDSRIGVFQIGFSNLLGFLNLFEE